MARKRNRKPHQKKEESHPMPENSSSADNNDDAIVSQLVDRMSSVLGPYNGPESKARSEGKLNVVKGHAQTMLLAVKLLPDTTAKMDALAVAAHNLSGLSIAAIGLDGRTASAYSELSDQCWTQLLQVACKLNDAKMKLRSTKMLMVSKREKEVTFLGSPKDSLEKLSKDRRILKGFEEIAQTLMEEAKNETDMHWRNYFIGRTMPAMKIAWVLATQEEDQQRVRMSTAIIGAEMAKCLEFLEKDQNVVWNEEVLDYVPRRSK